MKVLQIGLDWFPDHGGGLDRYFYDLLLAAPAGGMEVRGLVAGVEGIQRESSGRAIGFATRDRPLPLRLFAARRATVRELRDFAPDLVASHFALHALPSLDRIKTPLVVHFQGPWAAESTSQGHGRHSTAFKAAIERRVYQRADRCIVLSQAFGELLARDYGVSPDRIRVVPGSIDVARFHPGNMSRAEARARFGWPSDRPILLAVRRLVNRMGLENLIEAASVLTQRHPDLLVMIAGKGPEARALSQRIEALGLQDRIRLLGYVADEDLPAIYRAADLTIVPTESLEGFGLITAESLAAGTPVMVTPVGGLPEAVAPLSDELVLAGSTVPCLVDGIGAWLDGRLTLPGDAECVAYATAKFSWVIGIKRIKAVYEEAL